MEFNEYINSYPGFLQNIQGQVLQTQIPTLERIALRFSHALEYHKLDLKEGNERRFLTDLLVKFNSEMHATVGIFRHGLCFPAYHHARSLFELYAALEHIYCDPNKRERRLSKYVEYHGVVKLLHYRASKQQLFKNTITLQQFLGSCPLTEQEYFELKSHIPEWKKIWKVDAAGIEAVKNWHFPATIENLFEASDMTRTLLASYRNACHMTHLSPVALAVSGGYHLIGFPTQEGGALDLRRINTPILYCIAVAQQVAMFLRKTVGTGEIEGVVTENLEWRS